MTKRVVLAYSGGLDTSICIHWLHNQGFKVFTLLLNIGQSGYLEPLGEKAVELGAVSANISDLRQHFVSSFIFPTLKAGARYEKDYLLSAALSRPLIVQELVRVASEENCDFIAHGSRTSANDPIRFERLTQSLAPHLNIISPLNELKIKTTEELIQYANTHSISIGKAKQTKYNIEENLWGVNIQVSPKLDLWEESPADTYFITTPVLETSDKPAVLEIGFAKGVPISLNGSRTDGLKLIETLTKIGGKNAVGRLEIIENKISGKKSREVYEAPAATILYAAHEALENITLDKEFEHFKCGLSQKYGELVYEGFWFTPLRQALDQFFNSLQENVSGTVRLKLFKGNFWVTGRKHIDSGRLLQKQNNAEN